MFRRKTEALDPEVAQAFSYLHVRDASWMGSVPAASAPIFFMISSPCGTATLMNRAIYYKASGSPASMAFIEKKL